MAKRLRTKSIESNKRGVRNDPISPESGQFPLAEKPQDEPQEQTLPGMAANLLFSEGGRDLEDDEIGPTAKVLIGV